MGPDMAERSPFDMKAMLAFVLVAAALFLWFGVHALALEAALISVRTGQSAVEESRARLEAKRDAELDQASQLQAVGRDEDAATARACADRAAGLSEALTEVWAWRAGR